MQNFFFHRVWLLVGIISWIGADSPYSQETVLRYSRNGRHTKNTNAMTKNPHTRPDTIVSIIRFQRRNSRDTAKPDMPMISISSVFRNLIPLVNGGTALQWCTTSTIEKVDTNKSRSKKTARKKSMSWDCELFRSGSWVRRMVIAVNMKPARNNSPLKTFDLCWI